MLRHSALFLTSLSLSLRPPPPQPDYARMRARVESVCTTVNVCSRSFEYGPWKPFVADRGNLSGSRGREPRGILLLLLRLRASLPRLPSVSSS